MTPWAVWAAWAVSTSRNCLLSSTVLVLVVAAVGQGSRHLVVEGSEAAGSVQAALVVEDTVVLPHSGVAVAYPSDPGENRQPLLVSVN